MSTFSDDEDEIPLSVLRCSACKYSAYKKELHAHTNKIDKLLRANQVQKVNIPSDGDCFFAALKFYTYLEVGICRDITYTHIMQNVAYYRQFLLYKDCDFETEVAHLKQSGHWNSDIYDIMPTVLANIAQKKITIFSSNLTVMEVHPTLQLPPVISTGYPRIFLAHTAVSGHEHYDVEFKHTNKENNKVLQHIY